MLLPGRHGSVDSYRYGFNGKEKDDEVKGEANSINYKFRMHDSRLGRFFAVDPLTKEYPHYTPYSFSGNKVIHAIELEGLEEQIVHWQYLNDKIYKTVLKKSQFTMHGWRQMQKMWWRSIVINRDSNKSNFGGVGFENYYSAPFEKDKPRYDVDKSFWRGNDLGTLYVTDYHGQMIYGFNKEDAGTESYKISTKTLDILKDFTANVETLSTASVAFSGGTTAPVAVPLNYVMEVVGTIAGVEKAVIEAINGDIKKAIKTGVSEIAVPESVNSLFKKWRNNTTSNRGRERIDLLNNFVNRAISKGLNYIEVSEENSPTTTIEENESDF